VGETPPQVVIVANSRSGRERWWASSLVKPRTRSKPVASPGAFVNDTTLPVQPADRQLADRSEPAGLGRARVDGQFIGLSGTGAHPTCHRPKPCSRL